MKKSAVKKVMVLMVALWAAWGIPALGFGPPWEAYTNARFGYTVDVPEEFLVGEAPENNDGRTFTAPDGQGSVAVYGSFNALEHTPESLQQELRKDFLAPGGRARVTYEATGKSWCVLSGITADGAIFYQRGRFSSDKETLIAVFFVYPETQKDAWDPVVERMGKTLRFVDAEGN